MIVQSYIYLGRVYSRHLIQAACPSLKVFHMGSSKLHFSHPMLSESKFWSQYLSLLNITL